MSIIMQTENHLLLVVFDINYPFLRVMDTDMLVHSTPPTTRLAENREKCFRVLVVKSIDSGATIAIVTTKTLFKYSDDCFYIARLKFSLTSLLPFSKCS